MTQRRDFFKRLFSELYVLKEEAQGRRHFKLSDLWKLEETKFRQLKLRVLEGVEVQYKGKEICAKNLKKETVVLCATGTAEEDMFRLMQQRMAAGEIAGELASGADGPDRFQQVRMFLLSLVKKGVCVPANPVYYGSEEGRGYGKKA